MRKYRITMVADAVVCFEFEARSPLDAVARWTDGDLSESERKPTSIEISEDGFFEWEGPMTLDAVEEIKEGADEDSSI